MTAQRFPIGTTYKTRGKHPLTCSVTDFYTTTNLAGQVIRVRYVATHSFLGQPMEDRDVCETTIAMGLISRGPECSSPRYNIGDKVTFINDQGGIFSGKTIAGLEKWPHGTEPDAWRYFITPTDTPWFSFPERNLYAEAIDHATADAAQ